MSRARAVLLAGLLAGCGAPAPAPDGDAGCSLGDASVGDGGRVVSERFITEVVSFRPGEGASFGQAAMPSVVFGPPRGAGDLAGGTDAVSLGRAGEIVVGFSVAIVDGPGPDFIVFENPFQRPGREVEWWEELGEVSVSEDGTTWHTFRCDPRGDRPHEGCAGWNPVYSAPDNGWCPTDPRHAGGDPFDLAALGVPRARYVRIRDLETRPVLPPATGFDLDAIAVLHAASR